MAGVNDGNRRLKKDGLPKRALASTYQNQEEIRTFKAVLKKFPLSSDASERIVVNICNDVGAQVRWEARETNQPKRAIKHGSPLATVVDIGK